MFRKCLYIVLAVFLCKLQAELPPNYLQIMQKIMAFSGEKTFVFSYPRSANSWLRYCLEYCTRRPSFSRYNWKHIVNIPFGWTAGFEIDINKPPMEKAHELWEIRAAKGSFADDILILIIRNPKEVFTRHIGKDNLLNIINDKPGNGEMKSYFDDLEVFNQWNPNKKILLYYEDLISDPFNTLSNLLIFLGESDAALAQLKNLMDNYTFHKEKAISIYVDRQNESISKGNDIFYHSKSMNVEERKQVDAWIERKYPDIWRTFLKDRYSEEAIRMS